MRSGDTFHRGGKLLAFALFAIFAAASYPLAAQVDGVDSVTVGQPAVAAGEFNGDLSKMPLSPMSAGAPPVYRRLLKPPPLATAKQPIAPDPVPIEFLGGPRPPMPSAIANFPGMNFNDACTGGQCGAGWPPDTNGDVGPNHYIQVVNSGVAIYNKTGTKLASFTENQLWSGVGTSPCNGNSQGDPLVLYDWLADRWVLSWFAFGFSGNNPVSPYYQCIAASKTNDPVAGGWWLYAVRMDPGGAGLPPVGDLNDYGKIGLWHDCLYIGTNQFTNAATYNGVAFGSFSRANMYAGAALTYALGVIGPATSPFTLIPSNNQGKGLNAAQPGTPNYFVSESGTLFAFEVRKFTAGANCGGGGTMGAPVNVSQASYSLNFNNVPQPNTATRLDTVGDRLMQKVQYRKVAGAESLWVTHNIDNAGPIAMQWAQIGVTGGTVVTTPVQQGKHTPDTTLHRWMGSLAVDNQGNMALGYSTSNGTAPNFPSIAYAGRLATDPLNTLPQTETQLVAGLGSQTVNCGGGPCDRWGDYSSMSVDPADDCTFWYTTEYYSSQTNGTSGNWQTRIGSFKFPSCTPPVVARKLRDFNGDGKSDLLWKNSVTGQQLIWLMNGGTVTTNANLLNSLAYFVQHTPYADADNLADIIWRNNATGEQVLWLMNGAVPSTGALLLADPNWTITHTGDFNGDTKADLVWRNSATGETVIWLMDGLNFLSAKTLLTSTAWSVTHVGDFNGDGKDDLLWRNSVTGETVIWLMNGTSFVSGGGILTSLAWSVTHTGDFNADGKTDLVWRNSITGETAIWLMNGTSLIAGGGLLSDPNWIVTHVADLNGDGKSDVIWRNTATGALAAWLMNGAVLTSGAGLLPAPWQVVQTGDYDGNGKHDLVLRNTATGEVVLWLMNGTAPTAGYTLTLDPNWNVQ